MDDDTPAPRTVVSPDTPVGPRPGQRGSSAYVRGIKAQLPTVVIELLLLGFLWFFLPRLGVALVIPDMLAAGVAGAIILGLFVPPQLKWAGSLAAFAGLGTIAYFYYGAPRTALVLVVVGVLFAAMGFADRRGARSA